VSDHRPVTDPDGGPGPTPYVHPEYEPVDALTLRTSLPPEEVLDRLRGVFGGRARGRLRGTPGFEQGADRTLSRLTRLLEAESG
jgi:hypothetical protein